MATYKPIEHTGIIQEIKGNVLFVSIIAKAGCVSCQANTSCSVADLEEKVIEVIDFSNNYKVGEHVDVYYGVSLGYRALFFGYILPFLVLMVVLVTATGLGYSEGVSGLLALGALAPYYVTMYLLRNKMKKTFSFSVKKGRETQLNLQGINLNINTNTTK